MADITTNIFNLNNRNTPTLQRSYNDFQNELLRLDTHNSLVGSINQLRDDRIVKNKNNINNLDADLMTTRRQVEIIQNRNLIKEDVIYTLRGLFVLVGATVISYVYLEGSPYRESVLYFMGIISLYYFGRKGLSFISRSANRWSMTNWTGVKYNNPVKVEEADVCAAENAAYEAEMAKIKSKILDKLISMKTRFNKLDNSKKLLNERKIKLKNDYTDILNKADLIFDRLPQDKKTLLIEAKKKEIVTEGGASYKQPSQATTSQPQKQQPETSNATSSQFKSTGSNDDAGKQLLMDEMKKAPYPLNLLSIEDAVELAKFKPADGAELAPEKAMKLMETINNMLLKKGVSQEDIQKAFMEMAKESNGKNPNSKGGNSMSRHFMSEDSMEENSMGGNLMGGNSMGINLFGEDISYSK